MSQDEVDRKLRQDPAAGEAHSPVEVSVIVPTHNAAPYIASTLQSILCQVGATFEVLVIDDCSTDDTSKIVSAMAKTDARVRYVRLPRNSGGPATPRNTGINLAKGHWIAFCDADDIWQPGKLGAQLTALSQEDANLCSSEITCFSSEKDIVPQPSSSSSIICRDLSYWSNFLKNRIATSSVVCKRSDLLSGDMFDDSKSLVAVEDFDLWLRLMERPGFKAIKVRAPLVAYRTHVKSLSASKWRQLKKIHLVQERAADRNGWASFYPFSKPFLTISYISIWIYLRMIRRTG